MSFESSGGPHNLAMRSALMMPASRSLAALTASLLVLAFIAASWSVMLTTIGRGRITNDQNAYHLKAVEQFSTQWPHFDFSDYHSATTPGYHVVVAAVHRFITTDLIVLRLTGSLFTIGLLGTLAYVAARRLGPAPAMALGAPLAASHYVYASGTWLLPDNAAWWLVLGILLLALRTTFKPRLLILGGVLLVALVLVRQIHLWAASLIWLMAWLGSGANASAIWPLDLRSRLPRTALAVLVTLPAAATVYWFLQLWGGPVPKMFLPGSAEPGSVAVTGINIATPALTLALVGIFAPFYAALLLPAVRREEFSSARVHQVQQQI